MDLRGDGEDNASNFADAKFVKEGAVQPQETAQASEKKDPEDTDSK